MKILFAALLIVASLMINQPESLAWDFKIMLLDMFFMDSNFQPDTDGNGEGKNETGNGNDLENQ